MQDPELDDEIDLYTRLVMAKLEKAVEEINSHMKFLVIIYFLVSVCGIFNAWHILATNFYGNAPPHWCKVPELEIAGWTPKQIRDVSAVNVSSDGSSCSIVGWNYTMFVKLGYKESQAFIKNSTSHPRKTDCKNFYYDEKVPHSSVVSQWDLVCDKKFQKPNIQGSIALGKFIGGLSCGFIADMFGRKPTYLACGILYLVAGMFAALTDTFWIFLLARFWTGIAGIGCYEAGFTLLAEFSSQRYRAMVGCMYNLGYPVGFITLPGLSLLFPNWRHLQLAISIPMTVFIIYFWLLPESPRWLLVHGYIEKAWKVIKRFNKRISDIPKVEETVEHMSRPVTPVLESAVENVDQHLPGFSGLVKESISEAQQGAQTDTESKIKINKKISKKDRFKRDLKKIFLLFSTWELCTRIFINMFIFVVASLVFYVLALNAPNFELDQYMYTFIAGWVAIPGYIFPLVIMACTGRKLTSALLFFITGFCLIVITAANQDQKLIIFTLAMFGRFFNVAVFGLIIVYCAELFPTIVRNSAIGISLATSQIGSMYAPYVVDLLGPYGWYVPSTICGIFTILASFLILLLPETKGKPFLNTIDDVKKQGMKVSIINCCKLT